MIVFNASKKIPWNSILRSFGPPMVGGAIGFLVGWVKLATDGSWYLPSSLVGDGVLLEISTVVGKLAVARVLALFLLNFGLYLQVQLRVGRIYEESFQFEKQTHEHLEEKL